MKNPTDKNNGSQEPQNEVINDPEITDRTSEEQSGEASPKGEAPPQSLREHLLNPSRAAS